jgi:hypothetical protein
MRRTSCNFFSSISPHRRIACVLTTIPMPIPDRSAGKRKVDEFRYFPLRIRPVDFDHRIEELRLVFRSFRRPMVSTDGHRECEIGWLDNVSASER